MVPKGRCAAHARVREQQRPNTDIRKLYRTARWAATRRQVLQQYPLCPMCASAGVVCLSTEVDHIVPHKGDLRLFWKSENLQGLCHRHHGEKTGKGG